MTRSKSRVSKDQSQILVSILLSNEASPKGTVWIAQCLQWDIAGQGESPRAALHAFEQVFWAHILRDIEKGRPILQKEPAPQELWDQFRAGMPFRDAYSLRPPASIRLPRVEANEIRLAAEAA